MYSQKKKANCDCVSQMMSRPFFNGSAREAFDVIGFNGVSLSLSPPGSLLMFAPSSAETSTSIDSGDWLNRAGGGRGLLTSLVPLCRLPSCPPFPPRRPTSPLWASQTRPGETRAGGRPPDTGWKVRGHQGAHKLLRGVGGAACFFFSRFFICMFFLFFFQNKTEPLCLIAPDADCVHTEVSSCTRVGVCQSFFKLFLKIWTGEISNATKDDSTSCLLLHHP